MGNFLNNLLTNHLFHIEDGFRIDKVRSQPKEALAAAAAADLVELLFAFVELSLAAVQVLAAITKAIQDAAAKAIQNAAAKAAQNAAAKAIQNAAAKAIQNAAAKAIQDAAAKAAPSVVQAVEPIAESY
ncbi:MAG: hypothetical protein LBG13_00825 [Holosporales bacterium]|nr:hypothetical protein [Holosporales bacterium]